ncbi:LysR substrate-binding domain-containing protein [Thalassobius sp. MITS945101]|uniref:LysR substrate-binding domain-containing protein n=1 Tax=Thalassobius sp. MITS945101 TaxID=3096994 RepID=UPI003999FE90
MQIPNLNGLRAFDAAARHLNFRLAAEELLVTQGAVAQQIRKLEQDLGTPLFHRAPRGVRLTQAGARLHPNVTQAMVLLHQGLVELQESRTVTLSVSPSFATKWLLPHLPGLAQRHPDLTLNIRAEERVVDLDSGLADLAVRLGPRPAGDLESLELAPLRLVAVAQPDRFEKASALDQLTATPLIQDGHRDWQRVFSAAGLSHDGPLLQVNQTGLAMDAAAQGQGVALIPALYLDAALNPPPLEILWSPALAADQAFHLVWSSRRERDEMRQVRDWLVERAPR